MVDRAELEKELEDLLDYHFSDHHLLEELLQAAGSSVSDPTVHGDRHGNKRLALLGDSVLSTVLLEQWYYYLLLLLLFILASVSPVWPSGGRSRGAAG